MKRYSKGLLVLALMLLVIATALLMGCEPKEPPLSATAVYTVTLQDYQGNVPDVPILIELFSGETSLQMKKLGADGTVSFELTRGEYTFVPRTSAGDFYYDAENCTFTARKTSAQVTVYATATQKAPIFPHHGDEYFEYQAALVKEGATYVEIDRTDRSYYLFAPTRGGIYRFSFIADGEAEIGHFGDANVVLRDNAAQVENHSYTLEVLDNSVGTRELRLVIGLSASEIKNAILIIERIGDPKPVLPWTMLTPKQLPQDYIRSDMLNHKLVNISVTDPSVKVVFSKSDGYYHYGSETGPIVYVRIASDSPYINSFTEVCEAANMCRLYYDEEGNLVKKEGYNQLIMAYAEICDNNGVCPLTEEMIYVLKNNGEHMGWWDFGVNNTNIFTYTLDDKATGITEETLVKENAWMFACCYVEEFAYGSEQRPILLTPSDTLTYSAIVPESGTLYLRADGTTILTIEQAAGLTVMCNGQTYCADDTGKLQLTIKGSKVDLTVTSNSTVAFEFTYRLSDEK